MNSTAYEMEVPFAIPLGTARTSSSATAAGGDGGCVVVC